MNARRWVAAGALEQRDVENELYTAAEVNGLVGEDGERRTWATIRSGVAPACNTPRISTAER